MVLFECVKEALQKSGLKPRQVMTLLICKAPRGGICPDAGE